MRSASKNEDVKKPVSSPEPKGKRGKTATKNDPVPEKKIKTSDSIDVKMTDSKKLKKN